MKKITLLFLICAVSTPSFAEAKKKNSKKPSAETEASCHEDAEVIYKVTCKVNGEEKVIYNAGKAYTERSFAKFLTELSEDEQDECAESKVGPVFSHCGG